ncbi:MAG: 5-formyltetrahydrofolate cyclo-ligase [Victivallales bacterium]|nr:5-formyltetrahydrofolate cyclo-ligase [Victivallales bacterium]
MTPALTKNALRNVIRARLRETVPQNHKALQQRLTDLLAEENADCCIGFLAFRQEPVLDQFLSNWLAQNKKLLLPRFNLATRQYELVEVTDLNSQIALGHYGIREPEPQLVAIQQVILNTTWLVPGLAFTANGARLGRGAGYYDRLFQQFPQGKRIGIAWEMQLLPEIPQMSWDISMDYIVTESRTIDCRAPLT